MIILQYEGLCEGGRGERLGYTRVGTVNMTENKEGQCEHGTEDALHYTEEVHREYSSELCNTRKGSVNTVQKTHCITLERAQYEHVELHYT